MSNKHANGHSILVRQLRNENARLKGDLQWCIAMIDALIAESGREIEHGEEDSFRRGEWFGLIELQFLEAARERLEATP